MMKTPPLSVLASAVLAVTLLAHAQAQDGEFPPLISELEDCLAYARLLNAAKLTPEQLATLARAQDEWLDAAIAAPEVEDGLRDVAFRVACGVPEPEAMQALGESQRELQEARTRLNRVAGEQTAKLAAMFTEEQVQTLSRFNTPVTGLQNVVDLVARARGMPDEAWEQMRGQLTRNLAAISAQGGGREKAEPEQIEAWLNQARALEDAEFAAVRPKLAAEWAEALMPDMMRRLSSPEARKQRLRGTCWRLLTNPVGHDLVRAVIEENEERDE